MSNLSNYTKAITPTVRRVVFATTAVALVMGTIGYTPARAQQNEPQQTMQNAPQLSPAQLDQMVAPIALYPDNLLGQILAGSTYPLEVMSAARWSAANPRITGDSLANTMQSQTWDASVKALTAVPQVLKMMSEKIEWTQQLGEAYLSQPEDVAAAIQRLRARAEAKGNLKSTEQIRVRRVVAERPVVTERVVAARSAPEYIVIEPARPDVYYVPVYDPLVVYGGWAYPNYLPFFWAPSGYISVGIIGFGLPYYVGPALWATYNWNSGLVFCNAVYYSKFNKVPLSMAQKMASGPLKFDMKHHGNLGFKNPALNAHFNTMKPAHHDLKTDVLKKTTNLGPTHNLPSRTGKDLKLNNVKLDNGVRTNSHKSVIDKKVTGTENTIRKTISSNNSNGGGGDKTTRTRTNTHASLNTAGNAGGGNGGFKPPHAMSNTQRINQKH
jgi:hypothetical protein